MATGNELPDKEYLYGEFQNTQRWRDKLSRKLAHKSLDIPVDDEMIVTNTTATRTGLGWKEMAVLAASILGGAWIFAGQRASEPQPQQPAASSPADSEYEVRFFDAEGRPIEIPQRKP